MIFFRTKSGIFGKFWIHKIHGRNSCKLWFLVIFKFTKFLDMKIFKVCGVEEFPYVFGGFFFGIFQKFGFWGGWFFYNYNLDKMHYITFGSLRCFFDTLSKSSQEKQSKVRNPQSGSSEHRHPTTGTPLKYTWKIHTHTHLRFEIPDSSFFCHHDNGQKEDFF